MWHSSKVITTFDWLKSISRQRHELCISVCVYLSMHIYLNFISVSFLCVCRDCADKRRYAWNQVRDLSDLSNGTCDETHSQGQTGRQPARDKDEDEDGDEDMDEASFREINFNWVTDTDANTKNHMNNQRTKLICVENSKCEMENEKRKK